MDWKNRKAGASFGPADAADSLEELSELADSIPHGTMPPGLLDFPPHQMGFAAATEELSEAEQNDLGMMLPSSANGPGLAGAAVCLASS